MDDQDDRALLRVHERLATLSEKIASLQEHKAGATEMQGIERGYRDGDFRTLQEVGGLIGNMRSDVKDWISGLREKNALELAASEQRLMAAINAQNSRPWIQKNLGLVVALAGLVLAIVSGNPTWLKFGAF